MHPAEVIAARHADLLREATQARRVLAARRRNGDVTRGWRSRVGARLIALGESLGRSPAPAAFTVPQTERCC
jgi:hypothetical protein